MTATTTPVTAVNCVIQIDNAAGALTDISGSSNKADISLEKGVAEYRPFGNVWKLRKGVGKDGSFAIECVYTLTADEGADLLRDWFFTAAEAARSIQIDIPDADPGGDRYTAEVVLADFNIPNDAQADEFIVCTATLLPTGAITYAVIPT